MSASPSGFLLVDKPAGPTSHDVVQAARRALKERRIGHTGTLDPAATGLLLLCIGKATRLQQYLLAWEKTYHGEIRLGLGTTTYDAEGEALAPPSPVPELDEAVVAGLARRFSGEFKQLPPPYSAKKTGGQKFYELARAGEEVPLEPKQVSVQSIALTIVAPDRLGFEVTCSSGTYLRSLAHDIGGTLGCGGHLAALRRVRIGPWRVEAAVSAEAMANRPQEIGSGAFVSLPPRVAVPRGRSQPHGAGTLRPRPGGGRAGRGRELRARGARRCPRPRRRAGRRGDGGRVPCARADLERGTPNGLSGA